MNFFSVNSVLEKLCSFFYWSSYFTLTVISEYKQPLPGLATQYEFETKKLRSIIITIIVIIGYYSNQKTEHFSREGIREFRCQLSRIIDGIPDMAFFGIRSESFGLPHNSLIYWINVNWIFCL